MNKQKKNFCRLSAFFLSAVCLLSSCNMNSNSITETEGIPNEQAELSADISLWTYPVGLWGDSDTVDAIVANFENEYPTIHVTVDYLDYASGDAKVREAIEQGKAPDLIMEGPERLVSGWGSEGLMVNLNDIWTDEDVQDVADNSLAVLAACFGTDGNYYEYPLCMNAHCMAINKELFEQSGAMQYIDTETRTWTTEGFEKALIALKNYGVKTTGIVYCGGQGGDQGTRALAMNLYSAQFTNGAHTTWTMDSDAGIQGIKQLVEWCDRGLLEYNDTFVASDELSAFASGEAAMTFCWNASNMSNYAEQTDFTPYAVAFPSDDGIPELAGGIYGFGVFNNGNVDKIKAAKSFIQYVCNDSVQGPESVRASGFFPVRASFGDVYAGTDEAEKMKEFASFMSYLGDYYNVILGWSEQRTAWWTMLQQVFSGADVETSVKQYTANCNQTTNAILRSY